MENWKKEIIIDPHLNALFDAQISPQLFLKQKILTLAHPDIIKVYMKLTSLRHAITKNMQKEIEVCHPIIESSFQDSLQSKTQYERIDQDNIRDSLKQIQRFNEKYELISDRVTEIRNINKILHFAKAL
jgi:iron-sulfur cluster repair protein YtfE (RIC family)